MADSISISHSSMCFVKPLREISAKPPGYTNDVSHCPLRVFG